MSQDLLRRYLMLRGELMLSSAAADESAYNRTADIMDSIWWELSDREQEVCNRSTDGRWVFITDKCGECHSDKTTRYCPNCGHQMVVQPRQHSGPPRCMECMRDVAP